MKICRICKTLKSSGEFYKTPRGGLGSYCKECHKKKQLEWDLANRAKKLEYNRAWRLRNRERRKTSVDAGNILWKAIGRGDVIRGAVCEKCGGSHRIEASHADYSEPLKVVWLCVKCHRTLDASNPRTKSKAPQ